MHIIAELSEHPILCIIISIFWFLFCSMACISLLEGLLKMHRSKTAVKKLKKEYTFIQKLRLQPFEEYCLHGVKFCKGLIIFQKTGWLCFMAYLSIALLNRVGVIPNMVLVWCTVSLFVLFDVPMLILFRVFARPIIGRFKEFSFEKYHGTENYTSLL